ncbi:diguanylate cyclase [Amantichitinum ursilacus]|uniref:diguanylate cyclase n=1 Tax=Amantichitinum ursilacus TaxID=857265 RepID=A0A0N1JS65_9NEIS|nr:diguanylate cyclase [Amantichitinum ursilacus]KPC50458.1 Response regulator PleD [Amantichitinum ursilacus]
MARQSSALIYLFGADRAALALTGQQLAVFGFEVQSFDRVAELLAAMHSASPFAVLVDTVGADVIAQLETQIPLIKRLAHGPIFMAISGEPVSRQIALMRLGVTDFVNRPLDIQKLVARLDQQLDQSAPEPYRVLVVDDSDAMLKWLELTLGRAGMQVHKTHDPLDVLLLLERHKPEIVILDVYMPEYEGDEMARIIRQQPRFDGVPIVFLSTETNRPRQLMARSMGGDDFLVKNMPPEELVAVVSMTCERYRRLRQWMTRDSLTLLLNHTTLIESLETAVPRAVREQDVLSFVMIDIDHFKNINDQYGHMAGDHVIQSLARLLRLGLPPGALVGRYGGEEFAIVLPGVAPLHAAHLIDALRQRFAAFPQGAEKVATFYASFSAGVAPLQPGQSAQQLVEAADLALYDAKARGRNQVLLYSATGSPSGAQGK